MDKKVYILIGNIASGKTSWIKKDHPRAYVISKDDLREVIGNIIDKNYLYNEQIETEIDTIARATFLIALKLNLSTIIIDETNMAKAKRSFYINFGKQYEYEIIAIDFPVGKMKDHVERRFKENYDSSISKETWEEVFIKNQKEYEEPTFDEGFDQIIFIHNKN